MANYDTPLRPKVYSMPRIAELQLEGRKDIKPETLKCFAEAAWSEIIASGKCSKADLSLPDNMANMFRPMAYRFLHEQLPEPERASLAKACDEAEKRKRRWRWVGVTAFASVVPGSIALGLLLWAGGTPILASLLVAYLAVGMVAIAVNSLLLTPRFVSAVGYFSAVASLRLARIGLWALKSNGRWLRTTALAIFVVGSMLDLTGGWNDQR